MNIPKQINRRLLQKYRPSSIETFTNNLRNALNLVYGIEEYTLQPFKLDFDSFAKYINGIKLNSARKNAMSAVLAFLKADVRMSDEIIEKYQNLFDTVAKEIDKENEYKEPSEKELEKFISWELILENYYKPYAALIKDYPDQDFPSYEDKYVYLKYLILTLYTTIPPLRGEEYLNSVIIKVKNPDMYDTIIEACKCNLVDLEHNKLIIHFYKTSKTHEKRIIDIPKKTVDIITRWYRITDGNKYLLPNLQTPTYAMSPSALSHMLQRIFKPFDISTSMLRKIYISHILKSIYNKPKERKKLANIMGHTLSTQEFIYNRFKI